MTLIPPLRPALAAGACMALLLSLVSPAGAQVPARERAALVALYDATDGPNWETDDGSNIFWLGLPGSECNWTGVRCSQGRVHALSLAGFGLNGALPDEIADLGAIVVIDMSANQLQGELPIQLARLRNLRWLTLSRNGFDGKLPSEWGQMTQLRSIHLGDNQLSGPLPSSWSSLSQLEVLGLYDNRLSGLVPSWLGNLRQMKYLILNQNRFTGQLPSSLSQLFGLMQLSVADNDLSGPLPTGLANLSNLSQVNLSINRFTGPLPDLTRWTKLKWFSGDDNKFSGTIPANLGQLTELISFSFSFNRLTGPLPDTLGSMTRLVNFDVGGNQLDGEIPDSLTRLFNLKYLKLYNNRFEGEIPPRLDRLRQLMILDLGFNRLTGELPASLAQLPQMAYLLLESNALEGDVPESYLALMNAPGRGVNIQWNALTASGEVATFLNESTGFRYNQTQAPANIRVQGVGPTSVLLSWDVPYFTQLEGGYTVEHATQSGGPFSPVEFIEGKTSGSAYVQGLGPGDNFFAVRSVTEPHLRNQNRLISAQSSPIQGQAADVGARGGLTFTDDLFVGAPSELKKILVWRLEGSSGSLAANVYVDSTEADSFETRLRWADGEAGPKAVQVPMPASDEGGVWMQIQSDVLDGGIESTWVGVIAPREPGEIVLASDGDRPEIARTPHGLKAIVWSAPDADSAGIFAQFYNDLEKSLGPAIRLNQQEAGEQTDPSVAWDAANGRFVAVWSSQNNSTSSGAGIVGRFFEPYPQGAEDTPDEFEVVVPDSESDNGRPVVAVRENGQIVVAWESASAVLGGKPTARLVPLSTVGSNALTANLLATDLNVVGRFFDPAGSPLGPPVQLSPEDVPASSPDIDVGYDDDVGVVYEQDPDGGGSTEIILVDLGDDLNPDRIVRVNRLDVNSSSPRLEFTDDGDAAVVYIELQSPDDQGTQTKRSAAVKGRLFDTALNPKTDVFTISDTKSLPQDRPTLSINAKGDCFVVWQGGTADTAGSVHGAAVPRCSQKGGASVAVTESMGTGHPVVALEDDGTITTVFTSDALSVGRRAVAGKVSEVSSGGPCIADETTLCLNGGRFRVTARWRDFEGSTGSAQAETITDDTGYFWFFDSSNVEMILKVLDACAFDSNFWVFAGGLTSVEVDAIVTDTLTGEAKSYSNRLGQAFAPIQDTAAFSACAAGREVYGAQEAALQIHWPELYDTYTALQEAQHQGASCQPGDNTLCLNGGRYSVTVDWTDASGGSGEGRAVALTGDTGYFWFFDADNVEVAVKVLDACSFSASDWVFAAGLTNVAATVVVTDTVTGDRKVYRNPQGRPFSPIQDTSAFPSCGVGN